MLTTLLKPPWTLGSLVDVLAESMQPCLSGVFPGVLCSKRAWLLQRLRCAQHSPGKEASVRASLPSPELPFQLVTAFVDGQYLNQGFLSECGVCRPRTDSRATGGLVFPGFSELRHFLSYSSPSLCRPLQIPSLVRFCPKGNLRGCLTDGCSVWTRVSVRATACMSAFMACKS